MVRLLFFCTLLIGSTVSSAQEKMGRSWTAFSKIYFGYPSHQDRGGIYVDGSKVCHKDGYFYHEYYFNPPKKLSDHEGWAEAQVYLSENRIPQNFYKRVQTEVDDVELFEPINYKQGEFGYYETLQGCLGSIDSVCSQSRRQCKSMKCLHVKRKLQVIVYKEAVGPDGLEREAVEVRPMPACNIQ